MKNTANDLVVTEEDILADVFLHLIGIIINIGRFLLIEIDAFQEAADVVGELYFFFFFSNVQAAVTCDMMMYTKTKGLEDKRLFWATSVGEGVAYLHRWYSR